jgi:hypothetical protein
MADTGLLYTLQQNQGKTSPVAVGIFCVDVDDSAGREEPLLRAEGVVGA